MCILTHRTYQCSKCGKKFSRLVGDVITSEEELYPTCPRCGNRPVHPAPPSPTLLGRIKDYILSVIVSTTVI